MAIKDHLGAGKGGRGMEISTNEGDQESEAQRRRLDG
jgi:hypothetical protein